MLNHKTKYIPPPAISAKENPAGSAAFFRPPPYAATSPLRHDSRRLTLPALSTPGTPQAACNADNRVASHCSPRYPSRGVRRSVAGTQRVAALTTKRCPRQTTHSPPPPHFPSLQATSAS